MIDLWLPQGGPASLVVLIHGGFWRATIDRMHLRPMVGGLVEAGYAVAVPEYRRTGQPGGGWPGTFDDVAAVLDRLPELVAPYGLDAADAVWAGHSARGHLALWASLRHRLPAAAPWHLPAAPAVGKAVSLAGCADLSLVSEWRLGRGAANDLIGGTPGEYPDRYALADPSLLLPGVVPTIHLHGTDDGHVPIAIGSEYASRARRVASRSSSWKCRPLSTSPSSIHGQPPGSPPSPGETDPLERSGLVRMDTPPHQEGHRDHAPMCIPMGRQAEREGAVVPTKAYGVSAVRPSVAGVTAAPSTVFSRVTVVAPRTRIDLALPSDVAVAHLLPMVLTMAGEAAPDGGSRHGGWCLAKLGEDAIDPDRSLSSLGVVDGDLLQLRHRCDSPPLPLFDDVVEAIAVSAPDSYRPWTQHTARTLGLVAAGLALLAGAVALFRAGPGLGVAAVAGAGAVVVLVSGAVIARIYRDTGTGVLVASGSVPLGFVSGLYVVPGSVQAENLLLACTLALVLAIASIMVLGHGITAFVATATATAIGALSFLVASLVDRPDAGIAAAAAAVALGGISAVPRLTIQLSRLPMPQIPGSAEDLQRDSGFADYVAVERRAGLAHEYMTGMIIGCGVTAAAGAVLASTGGALGIVLAVVVAAVLLLRARAYANGSQAIALLASGMVAVAGLLTGLLVAANQALLLTVFAGLLVLATLALALGVVLPSRRFSPVLRRSVDVIEAMLIAAVLPLALGVLDLYNTFRAL